jgi:NitT/TauT family transport system permease protein/sulfonate transport system permease protein
VSGITEAASLDRARRFWAHGFTLAVILAWAIAGLLLPPYLVAGPWVVLLRLSRFFTDRTDAMHLAASFGHVLGSVVMAFVVGGALALANQYLPVTRLMIRHRWYPFLNSFSGIGWAVLAVLWFGPSNIAVLFALTSTLVPFIFVNLREGLEALDRELLEMGESFTRSGLRRFRLLVLPSLYPFIFAALRIAFGVGWKACLIAELYGSNRGLGFLINVARQEFDSATIFAVIAVIIVMVFVTDRCVLAPLQARVSRHHADA